MKGAKAPSILGLMGIKMEDRGYSEQFATEILEKIHNKGWDVYLKTEGTDPDDNIRRNRIAERLGVNQKYVLLPAVNEPASPEKVMAALEALAIKLDRQPPTIKIGDWSHPFLGFTLNPRDVKLHTPQGTILSYPRFIDALDTIVDAHQ